MRLRRLKYAGKDFERMHGHKKKNGDERSEFEIDRSRIIHSSSFRRLQGKTQLFAPAQSDFYRTRLTHSLEVAQIAKGIALRLGADTDICEAASLAHDIGHPPFGHQGEKVLSRLTRSIGGFEANAQNFRVVGSLEHKYSDCTGLDLCRSVLDALFKYKEVHTPGKERHFYYENDEIASWLLKDGDLTPSFECQIMNLSDDIAYAVHDLEDGLRSGIVTRDRGEDSRRVILEAANAHIQENGFEVTDSDIDWALERVEDGTKANSSSADATTKELTSGLINEFIRDTNRIPSGISSATSDRYRFRLDVSQACLRHIEALKSLAYVLLISDSRVNTLEMRSGVILKTLYSYFARSGSINSFPEGYRPEPGSSRSDRARRACDYISGMTDDYAQRLYRRLFTAERVALLDV